MSRPPRPITTVISTSQSTSFVTSVLTSIAASGPIDRRGRLGEEDRVLRLLLRRRPNCVRLGGVGAVVQAEAEDVAARARDRRQQGDAASGTPAGLPWSTSRARASAAGPASMNATISDGTAPPDAAARSITWSPTTAPKPGGAVVGSKRHEAHALSPPGSRLVHPGARRPVYRLATDRRPPARARRAASA